MKLIGLVVLVWSMLALADVIHPAMWQGLAVIAVLLGILAVRDRQNRSA